MNSLKGHIFIQIAILNSLLISNNLAQTTFTQHVIDYTNTFSVYCVDMNKDGRVDILSHPQWQEIYLYINNGNFSFTRTVINTNLGTLWNVCGFDLDKDSDMDILAVSISLGDIFWCRNDGALNFSIILIDQDLGTTECIRAADMDNDGDNDVVSIGIDNSVVTWYKNNGYQYFSKHTIANDLNVPHYISLGDYNKDGFLDISCASAGGWSMRWFRNNGSGSFTKYYVDSDFSGAYSVESVDFNYDGSLDLLGAAHSAHQIAVWLNNGGGGFNKIVIANNFNETHSAYAADFDNDGDMDVVGASREFNEVAWWENRGSNYFVKQSLTTSLIQAQCVSAADFNNDGKVDIVGTSRTGSKIVCWENVGSAIPETVSTPNQPTGPTTGVVGGNLTYVTGGAVSSYGHSVEYQFDWGNGQQSSWGSSTASYTFTAAGTYYIKARARCQTHTSIVSSLSSGLQVNISSIETITTPSQPSGPSSGTVGNSLTYVTGGAVSSYGHSVEYQFDWGNGQQSSWGASTASYTFAAAGTFYIKARARCQTHTGIVSSWSNGLQVTILSVETITTPTQPTGPNSGTVGNSLTYVTGGAISSYGHSVEYQFDWGNGQQSSWGASTASYTFAAAGTYYVKARARCQSHTAIVSSWSNSLQVTISPVETITTPSQPTGPSSGTVGNSLTYVSGGAVSNVGHSVEYQFDWGNGQQSSWGASTTSYAFTAAGTYYVKAQARCQSHTNIVSAWSTSTQVTISPNEFNVSGGVLYFSNDLPVANTTITISGDMSQTRTTNAAGVYSATVQAGRSIVLTPSKTKGENVGAFDITMYDAALTARHALGLMQLDNNQQSAADADKNEMVQTYDAALIARHSVGLPALPSTYASEWRLLPASRNLTNINSDKLGENFTAIIIGNVHGGWSQSALYRGKDDFDIEIHDLITIEYRSNDVLVRFYANDQIEILSANIELLYDDGLEFSTMERQAFAENLSVLQNIEAGRIRIGFFSFTPICQSGEVFRLIFEKKNSIENQQLIQLKSLIVNNDRLVQTAVYLGQDNRANKEFNYELHQNYPNPFNSSTIIRYELTEGGLATIKIFNIFGQEIKSLVNGYVERGQHEVMWDGKDNVGKFVASGVYVYQLQAGASKVYKKLIIME